MLSGKLLNILVCFLTGVMVGQMHDAGMEYD